MRQSQSSSPARRRRLPEIIKLISSWRRSGGADAAGFCRRAGIRPATLRRWLARVDRGRTKKTVASGFVQIGSTGMATGRVDPAGVVIVIGPVRIAVAAGCDPVALVSAVRAAVAAVASC